MKPHTQAVREAQAWERIEAAAQRLAAEAGVQVVGLDATHRDPGLQQLFRMEALADFLEGATLTAVQPEPAKGKKTEAKDAR